MSILKYFHRNEWKDQERDQADNCEIKLPDPDEDLSKVVPSKAIRAANKSIQQILEPKEVKNHIMYIFDSSPTIFCWQEGGGTWSHGTLRYYAKCFPYLALKETTVRRIKNVYLSELKKGHLKQVTVASRRSCTAITS